MQIASFYLQPRRLFIIDFESGLVALGMTINPCMLFCRRWD